MALVLDGDGLIRGFNILGVDSSLEVGTCILKDSGGTLSIQDSTGSSISLVSGSFSSDNLTVGSVLTQGSTNYVQKSYVLHGTTTNNTETEIARVGNSGSIPVDNNSTVFYEASVVARRTDASGESAAWHLKGCADNFSGTVADVGDVYEIAVAQDDIEWAVDIRADSSNDTIDVLCTGATGKTINWTAVVKTIEVHQ